MNDQHFAYLEAIRDFYRIPGNECGGVLHIALDDGNMTKGNLDFCSQLAKKNNDAYAQGIIDFLMSLTFKERMQIYYTFSNDYPSDSNKKNP